MWNVGLQLIKYRANIILTIKYFFKFSFQILCYVLPFLIFLSVVFAEAEENLDAFIKAAFRANIPSKCPGIKYCSSLYVINSYCSKITLSYYVVVAEWHCR